MLVTLLKIYWNNFTLKICWNDFTIKMIWKLFYAKNALKMIQQYKKGIGQWFIKMYCELFDCQNMHWKLFYLFSIKMVWIWVFYKNIGNYFILISTGNYFIPNLVVLHQIVCLSLTDWQIYSQYRN